MLNPTRTPARARRWIGAAALVIAALTAPPTLVLAQDSGRYTVQEGDSLWEIAKKHGVTVAQIKRWNKLAGDSVRAGTVLVVQGDGKAAPVKAEPPARAEAKVRVKAEKPTGGGGEAPRIEGDVVDMEVDDAFCAKLKQPFKAELTRSHYRADCDDPAECVQRHLAVHEWRTTHYGYYKGFSSPKLNGYAPSHYTRDTTFQGIKITINEHLVAPLKCIERELASGCASCTPREEYPNECKKRYPYTPGALSGLRTRNTFRGGEVSNHVYGIAVDLDPADNTCCGCVGKWKKHPMCRKPLPAHERMIMPYCWVEVFESYGFYWLGRDKLQDTMHFEFLGDPVQVRQAVNAALGGKKP